ncbi:MAG: hypothetical protein NT151_04200 [Acidobacteria bacterium]|nr:hypothetical protein [Acidobacteriota bacterium]
MIRHVYAAVAVLVILALSVGTVIAQTTKYVAPVKGVAEIQYLPIRPEPDYKAKIIRTIVRVKNVSPTGSIAGLKVTQYWYDKANSPQPVAALTGRVKKPLLPGEETTITLEAPLDPKMFRDYYEFEHANGKIKPKPVKRF